MRKSGSKALSKVGMVLGIVIIGGSILGGIAFAAGGDRGTATDSVPTVPLGNGEEATGTPEATATPTATVTSPATTSTGGAGAGTVSTPRTTAPAPVRSTSGSTPPSTPNPTPTCWDPALGEHPPGIEDCPGH